MRSTGGTRTLAGSERTATALAEVKVGDVYVHRGLQYVVTNIQAHQRGLKLVLDASVLGGHQGRAT